MRRFVARSEAATATYSSRRRQSSPSCSPVPSAARRSARSRSAHGLAADPLVLYVGRFVLEKGLGVLLDAWPRVHERAALVLIGDGPLAERARATTGAHVLGAIPRADLAVAYASAELALLPSIPTPRFREPWGLVCNEAMDQARPVVASDAVGAVAGGLVVDDHDWAGRPRRRRRRARERDLAAARRRPASRAASEPRARDAVRPLHVRGDGAGLRARWRLAADPPSPARSSRAVERPRVLQNRVSLPRLEDHHIRPGADSTSDLNASASVSIGGNVL